jgi:hypothetical protein
MSQSCSQHQGEVQGGGGHVSIRPATSNRREQDDVRAECEQVRGQVGPLASRIESDPQAAVCGDGGRPPDQRVDARPARNPSPSIFVFEQGSCGATSEVTAASCHTRTRRPLCATRVRAFVSSKASPVFYETASKVSVSLVEPERSVRLSYLLARRSRSARFVEPECSPRSPRCSSCFFLKGWKEGPCKLVLNGC